MAAGKKFKNGVTHVAYAPYKDIMLKTIEDPNEIIKTVRFSTDMKDYYLQQLADGDIVLPEELKDFPFDFTFDLVV